MIFAALGECLKDLKKLEKKCRSLPEDLEIVKQVLTAIPDERPPFSFRIDHLGITTCIIKVKKIACKSLKGRGVNSGIRLVYAYSPVETKIIFVELYHKSDQENEGRTRILKYFS